MGTGQSAALPSPAADSAVDSTAGSQGESGEELEAKSGAEPGAKSAAPATDSGTPDTGTVFIEESVLGKQWRLKPHCERTVLAISQRHDLPEIVARILDARGVALDAVEDFLYPTLRKTLPDPSIVQDMDKAAVRVAEAIQTGEGLGIFGDYDVDGATSAALMVRYFRALGVEVPCHIPDRLDEGYGPGVTGFARLQELGAELVITVDCGVSAFEELEKARAMGLDVVVLDHHAPGAGLPVAAAVVNPNRLDDESGLGSLAAVGVCFMFAVACTRALRLAGFFENRPEPDLRELLDLVAMGTVCDVVPLVGLNRVFVTQGLKVLAKGKNLGLQTLAQVAGVQGAMETYHFGFVLGPRINAGGRVGKASYGARLLITEDPAEALRLAEGLTTFNEERRRQEAVALEEALAQVEAGQGVYDGFILARGEEWHPGVVGIVAGRLKEMYQLPVAVVTRQDGNYKGSSRSVEGLDLGAAVIAAKQLDLALTAGGHAMAAGFTATEEQLPKLAEFISQRFSRLIADNNIRPRLHCEGMLTPRAASCSLLDSLLKLQPFGAANPQPRFIFNDVRLSKAQVVGRDHVRCYLAGADGGNLKAMAYRAAGTDLGRFLLDKVGDRIHLVGSLRQDNWNGYSNIQMVVDDAAPV